MYNAHKYIYIYIYIYMYICVCICIYIYIYIGSSEIETSAAIVAKILVVVVWLIGKRIEAYHKCNVCLDNMSVISYRCCYVCQRRLGRSLVSYCGWTDAHARKSANVVSANMVSVALIPPPSAKVSVPYCTIRTVLYCTIVYHTILYHTILCHIL